MDITVHDFQWEEWKTLIIGTEEDTMDFGFLTYYRPNNDWEQLMSVVEKIESLQDEYQGRFGVHIVSNTCTIQSLGQTKKFQILLITLMM